MRSMSPPAWTKRTAASSGSKFWAMAPMLMESLMTTPVKPSLPRSASVIMMRESVAGSPSPAALGVWM